LEVCRDLSLRRQQMSPPMRTVGGEPPVDGLLRLEEPQQPASSDAEAPAPGDVVVAKPRRFTLFGRASAANDRGQVE
jgi:hypothetical protein